MLTGEVCGSQDGESVSLSYPILKDGTWYERELTTEIVDGKFVFEGELPELSVAHLWFGNMDEVQLFIEPRRMKIEIERSRPYDFMQRGVSVWAEYEEYRKSLGDLPQALYEKLQDVQVANVEWLEATQKNEPSADSLMRAFCDAVAECRVIQERRLMSMHSFLIEHQDYRIAPYVLYDLAFAEGVSDEELFNLYGQLSEENRESAMGLLAKQRIDLVVSEVGGFEGDMAFDFEREDAVSGERVKMSDYLGDGEYLLLDFWASWCAPCIEQMADVKRVYDKYSSRGLRMIGISSDTDNQAWRNAIERYGLEVYPQVLGEEQSEERFFFDELANVCDRYEVESIPCFILVNDRQEIVARWQHFDEQVLELIEGIFGC